MTTLSANWSPWRLFLFRFFMSWVLLYSLTVPFDYHLLPETGNWVHAISRWMVQYSARIFVGTETPYEAAVLSDSTGGYVHVFNTLVLAMVIALAWTYFSQYRSHRQLQYWLIVYVRYFLALLLLSYGFDKVFKAQFYLPEPNILYTPFGELYADTIYWSSIGISRSYSMFLGIVEMMAALLLFFRRTAMAGALAAFFVMINVTAINFAYDISVKLLSLFLLTLSLYLVLIEARRVIGFMSGRAVEASTLWRPQWKDRQRLFIKILKAATILLLILESCWLYLRNNNFNDDKMPRPYLHGAWEVKTFVINNDTLPPLLTDSIRWKRVFFHRQGYFIIQKMDDSMMDTEMEIDTMQKKIYLYPPGGIDSLLFNHTSRELLLENYDSAMKIKVRLEKLDWEKLPALKKEFHWRVDEVLD